MNKTGYFKIHNDHWGDFGKLFKVLDYQARQNSTAVDITFKHEHGIVESRVLSVNQIEWISDGDW